MKGIIAAAFAASLGVVGATSAGAMPLAPFGGAQDGLIEHVAQGCGPGFGRDALGEQCVLAFTYSQQPSPAHLFLGYAGALEIARRATVKVPVLRAVREAQKMGKACPRLVETSISDLLPLPFEEVRRRLNIKAPSYYQRAHAEWRAAGIDPYDLLSTADKLAA